MQLKISVQTADFDTARETEALRAVADNVGAVASFTGVCRSEDGRLKALELEHYPGMADREIRRIAEDAAKRWPLYGLTAIHRYGLIPVGENIVLVMATSSHREAAFEATNFMMDFLKTSAPFWKKEHFFDGSEGDWVEAKTSDDIAMARWTRAHQTNEAAR